MPVVMVSDLCLYFFDKVGKIISDGSKNYIQDKGRSEQNHAAAFGTH
jgi:hypothetical protein